MKSRIIPSDAEIFMVDTLMNSKIMGEIRKLITPKMCEKLNNKVLYRCKGWVCKIRNVK